MIISEIGEDTFVSMEELEELHHVQDVEDGMDQTVKLLTPGEDQIRNEFNLNFFYYCLMDIDFPHTSRSTSSAVIYDI